LEGAPEERVARLKGERRGRGENARQKKPLIPHPLTLLVVGEALAATNDPGHDIQKQPRNKQSNNFISGGNK